LYRYRGDSSLFIAPASYAALVLDDRGHVIRQHALAPSLMSGLLATNHALYGYPSTDGAGRIVLRIPPRASSPGIGVALRAGYRDSAAVGRLDILTRLLDTIA